MSFRTYCIILRNASNPCWLRYFFDPAHVDLENPIDPLKRVIAASAAESMRYPLPHPKCDLCTQI